MPSARESLFFTGTTFRGGSRTGKNFIKSGPEAHNVLAKAKVLGEAGALQASYGNAGLQNSRKIETDRIVIDFWSLLCRHNLLDKSASTQIKWLRKNYPYLLSEISGTQKVRLALPNIPSNAFARTYWWLPSSIDASLRLDYKPVSYRIAVGAKATKIWALHKVPVLDEKWGLPSHIEDSLTSCPFETLSVFAVLQSILGEIHVRRLSSSLQTSLCFCPTFALKGFPFPWASQWSIEKQGPFPTPPSEKVTTILEPAITNLLDLRDRLLKDPETLLPEIQNIPTNWGMTQLYNHYDNDAFSAPNIQLLRQAHIELLEAVLTAYVSDTSLPQSGPMFEALRQDMAQSENNGWCFDHPWIDRTVRFVPTREFRDRITKILLVANRERWEQEISLIANKVQEVLHKHGYHRSKPNNLLQLALQNGVRIHKDDYEAVMQKLGL